MGKKLLPDDILDTYQIEERHHACSILKTDFPEQWKDLIEVLRKFKLKRSDIAKKGGNKSPISRAIDGLFFDRGWTEKSFEIKVTADGAETLVLFPQFVVSGACELDETEVPKHLKLLPDFRSHVSVPRMHALQARSKSVQLC